MATRPLISDFYAAADDIAARLQPGTALVRLVARRATGHRHRRPRTGKGRQAGADRRHHLLRPARRLAARHGRRKCWPNSLPAVAADIEAMLPRFVGGFNRGDARAKSVTRELLELADARPSGATYWPPA
jgi:pimeloyl-[acyl-carrier protein] methyl ester esterase